MTDRVKNVLLIVLSITALALGRVLALAGAASGGSGSGSNGNDNNNSSPARPQFGGPGRAGQALCCGPTPMPVDHTPLR